MDWVITAIIAMIGYTAAWVQWRKRELRREEVFAWANESIDVLTRIWFLAENPKLSSENAADLATLASVQCEKGRLFFKMLSNLGERISRKHIADYGQKF